MWSNSQEERGTSTSSISFCLAPLMTPSVSHSNLIYLFKRCPLTRGSTSTLLFIVSLDSFPAEPQLHEHVASTCASSSSRPASGAGNGNEGQLLKAALAVFFEQRASSHSPLVQEKQPSGHKVRQSRKGRKRWIQLRLMHAPMKCDTPGMCYYPLLVRGLQVGDSIFLRGVSLCRRGVWRWEMCCEMPFAHTRR